MVAASDMEKVRLRRVSEEWNGALCTHTQQSCCCSNHLRKIERIFISRISRVRHITGIYEYVVCSVQYISVYFSSQLSHPYSFVFRVFFFFSFILHSITSNWEKISVPPLFRSINFTPLLLVPTDHHHHALIMAQVVFQCCPPIQIQLNKKCMKSNFFSGPLWLCFPFFRPHMFVRCVACVKNGRQCGRFARGAGRGGRCLLFDNNKRKRRGGMGWWHYRIYH